MKAFLRYPYQLLVIFYIVIGIALFLFSFTQVDLSLTLSKASVFQTFQKTFQHIGFYQRPLATVWYLFILVLSYLTYIYAIYSGRKKLVTEKQVWRLVGIVVVLLVLSYPAFSYDMFNYMFTAKTVLVYHKNPYDVTPLQFAGVEPWLSFMHWTHLPSAYTPLWILLTLSTYIFSFGYFLLLLWNIKVMVAAFYILAIWCIGKIGEKIDPASKVLGMIIFAFNPLVIIETLVSGHNDIAMMALALGAFYLFLIRHRLLSYMFLALSVAMKLMTIFLYPVALLGWNPLFAVIAMVIGLILVIFQREVLSWYFLWIIPFIALVPQRKYIVWLATAFSLGLLLRYAPYLYLGHWNDPVPTIKTWVTTAPILFVILLIGVKEILTHRVRASRNSSP
ncbi:hypothetical protein A2Z00_05870 [Candidatus Gottesmanbacteria bacterium RBG_13_45_10]|uniref:DUF2029 domain-containing protein n=1 Tax=Candidatus Gottesmanbacteria bacterium RBG_13_45_10 TaxID=1798370 RepID=A0A1F5ZIM0_9BACT|nr:MAG: hypothetical protein A2Z00_05870 [Candidatus Gottesmanbacteria bacterium RBG_13_45_10]